MKYKVLFTREYQRLRTVRRLLGIFIIALLLSGLTVWPADAELRFALRITGTEGAVGQWLQRVHSAYTRVGSESGFLFYGYDWLAFAHVILAGLFVGPWLDPVRNRWVIQFGLGACAAILPLAFICGTLRGIPFWWQLVDCSFGVFGAALLCPCHRLALQLERDNFQPQNQIA
ncbi:hypothetical protein EPD60_09855 [Flaviaesturariibacter flavus]|uniref:Uncharacterized protein n=1 Tax=Flaviaesturariibacter flavus TaxID=2502780 RepID=A0A4R1BBB7_9BACT|nr:hypothetical protein [Flaviaesturariibacter flavus]TCJ14295.1 hypothetical protein EPD60_09855 [Flaviaesturariibacter flavus]